jgi:hypothetical protein
MDDEAGSSDECCGVSSNMMKHMLDVSLLKDPVFILFTLSNFCTSIGFNIPYVYIVVSTTFFFNNYLHKHLTPNFGLL